MAAVFIDTGYLVGLLYPKDGLHERAMEVSKQLSGREMVTSELVFVETLNSLSGKGNRIRMAGVQTVMALRQRLDTKIVAQSHDLFEKAFDRYRSREDQEWGLVDCASFVIMEDHRITEALTYDKHYVQAGFVALLRDS